MTLKQYFIIFLVLFVIPIFMGKVSGQPFSNFFQHISFDTFWKAFTQVFTDDFNFYKSLVMPWIQQLINLIKNNIPTNNILKTTP